MCPRNDTLNENCFQKIPLEFVGLQSFIWGDGVQIYFNGTYVSEGTLPKGSTWAMNPIPRNDTAQTGQSFKPRYSSCAYPEVYKYQQGFSRRFLTQYFVSEQSFSTLLLFCYIVLRI